MPSLVRARPPAMEAAADDAALVARARFDRSAFGMLYQRHFDGVLRYCRARLGDDEAAEDAASVVFAKAMAALPRFAEQAGTGGFRAWLFRIAHNATVDAVRALRATGPLDEALDLPDPGPTPEEAAVDADERHALHALLAQLPETQRRVVALRLGGLNAVEIAAVLGTNRTAVDAAQYRAVTRLRSLMGVAQENEGSAGRG